MGDPGDNIEKLNLHGLSTEDYIKAEALLSVEQKSALAVRLATGLNARDANIEDSASAEAILRLIIWNAEASVVESMAHAAAANPNTPHSLAWALANDDEAAAMLLMQLAEQEKVAEEQGRDLAGGSTVMEYLKSAAIEDLGITRQFGQNAPYRPQTENRDGNANNSNAAKEILEKYRRRPKV